MLLVAPHTLRNQVLQLIDQEIHRASEGLDSYIGLKLNSISDKIVIEKLMEASDAGVHVDLIVRGICCVIGGILLIALVLMILGIRKKKQLAAAQTADAPEAAQPEPQETDPNYQSILEKNSNDD